MRRIEVTREALERVCSESRTNEEAGKKLGVSKSTITRMCRRLHVKIPQERAQTQRGGRRKAPVAKDISTQVEDYLDDVHLNGTNMTRNGPPVRLSQREQRYLGLYRAAHQPPLTRITPQDYEQIKEQEATHHQQQQIQDNLKSHQDNPPHRKTP